MTNLAIHPRSRVDVPGLHLQSNPEILPNPFDPTLLPPFSFLLPHEMRSTRKTRCLTQPQDSPFVSEPSLPSRISRSFGIKALNPVPNNKACFCESSDFPSLPVALKIITYDHALRINVPDPLLPAKLTVLQTSWNQGHHAPMRLRSQSKKSSFLRKYVVLKSIIYTGRPWMICE
jgi:hypothetical protein